MIKNVEFNAQTNHVNNIFHDNISTDYVVLTGYEIVEKECEQLEDGSWQVIGQTKPLSELEQLRLEMARSNAEMFETMIMLLGGDM